MKLIFLNRYFYPDCSATSQMLSDLAFGLSERGYEVYVITGSLCNDGQEQTRRKSGVINGVNVIRPGYVSFGRNSLAARLIDYILFCFMAVLVLFRLVKKGDIVIAKSDPPLLSVFAGPVVKLKGARLVNWIQDIFPEIAGKLRIGGIWLYPVYRVLAVLRNRSLKAAEINIVPGKLMSDHLREQGIPESRLHVIPNWSDKSRIYPVSRESNPLRKEWGLDNCFVVGYSGNLGRVHCFETILNAASRLQEMDHDNTTDGSIVFLITGGGHGLAGLRDRIRERKLNNVRLQPLQPMHNLARSLSVPDVHLISLRTGFEGLVVPSKFYGIAAAARTTLYIGSENGEIPSLLTRYGLGSVIAENDDAGLVAEILNLWNSPESCAQTGKKARHVFEKKFDRAISLQKWDVILRNVIATA